MTICIAMPMANVAHTKVFAQVPCATLRPFVKRFLVVEYSAAHSDAHLPDTGLVAAFRFKGDCRLYGGVSAPQSAVTGLWDFVRTHEHSGGNAIALVAFTPMGASAFLRQPLNEFSNATVSMEKVLGRADELERMHEQLATAANHVQRVRLMEKFLLAHLVEVRPDPLVSAAVSWIEKNQAMGRVAALTRYVGLSQSALERRFRRLVGLSPRKFASIVRLQHVLRLRATGADLTSIAHTSGYFDQSHFIKDFRRFTGAAPESFFRRVAAI